jgi:hypothetical protein
MRAIIVSLLVSKFPGASRKLAHLVLHPGLILNWIIHMVVWLCTFIATLSRAKQAEQPLLPSLPILLKKVEKKAILLGFQPVICTNPRMAYYGKRPLTEGNEGNEGNEGPGQEPLCLSSFASFPSVKLRVNPLSATALSTQPTRYRTNITFKARETHSPKKSLRLCVLA